VGVDTHPALLHDQAKGNHLVTGFLSNLHIVTVKLEGGALVPYEVLAASDADARHRVLPLLPSGAHITAVAKAASVAKTRTVGRPRRRRGEPR
jgi:hypothetical protein